MPLRGLHDTGKLNPSNPAAAIMPDTLFPSAPPTSPELLLEPSLTPSTISANKFDPSVFLGLLPPLGGDPDTEIADAEESKSALVPTAGSDDVLLTSELNGKQLGKRVNKARIAAIEVRNIYWPEIKPEDLWLLGDRKRGGFAQIPRTLSMMMNVINDISKRKTGKAVPAGKTYLVLWLHVFDEGIVRIDSEADAAFEAGYAGERNVTTFRNHMNMLKELGFIDFRGGPKGPMQYVLLLNPYTVIKQLRALGLVPDPQYVALIERASFIGSSHELKAE